MDNLKGQVIRGYELQELVGEGGFGAVYRAVQTVVSREVGIKIILPQYANEPEFIRRFEAEAQLIARLEHLHIVPLYDYWRDPSGAYLVMRYLRGGTLRQALSDKGAWSAKATARLLSQIGAALTVAHRNNVVHRDVKPSNILLDEDKNAYLSDFGIATQQVSANKITSNSGRVTGSAGYISPEQINLEAVSSRTDVYAMSIILYEMLTGAHPYAGAKSPMALFIKHVNEPLPPMFGVPQEVQDVVFKGASKDPNQRYGDLLEMANAFRQAITETGFIGLRHDPEAAEEFDSSSFDLTPTPTSIMAQNPYKGLRAFQESDAGDFFGREALTKQLLKRMDEDTPYYRFLAVVGPSGSGKSSVVKAGVIPALRQNAIEGANEWFIAEMTPGVSPFDELTQAFASISATELPNLRDFIAKPDSGGLNALLKLILPTRTSELLLVIDQFEEAFTQGNDSERTLFLNALQDAVTALDSRLRVIVTLRADFYDRPLMVQNFSQLMQQRTEVVIPLTADELERAVTAPSRQVKVFFQQGLSALIVSEVNEQPGVLPMLQYALTELFERREGALLTLRAYQDIGGVLGALARRAEEIYTQLNGDEREATRQLFLRLVTLGEGTEDTRRRALQSEIIAASETPAVMQAVIESFGNYRLLTYDRDPITRTPTVEVAHEALIREWQRLREWLDESREDIRLQRLLSNATNEWQEANRDPSFLLRGGRLIQFEEWAKTSTIAISQQERDYLSASIAERERQEARERERQENELELERRAKQRARLIIAILSVAFVGGILLSVFAFNQSQVAQTQADIANTQVAIAATAQQEAVLQAGTAVSAQSEAQAQADIANTQVVIVALAQQDALNQAATATNAQGQAQAQADIANTQVVVIALAQQDALDQAATATNAQGQAQAQADIANTQVAIAATARQDAVLQAGTAVSAQGEAQAQADIANTQVAIAATARQDAVLQAGTAVSAQGEAQAQADIANTQVAIAATARQDAVLQAGTAVSAQGEAQAQADIANTQVAIAATARQDAVLQAGTAVSAQGEAQAQADIANTQVAIAATARQDAVLQAGTAVSAQGEAQAQADIANTQVAIAATARQDAVLQAGTAVSAQGEAQAQADIANTQVAIAATAQRDTLNQANIANTQVAIAATARQDAVLQASTAVSAQSEAQRQAQASQSLALAANASQLQTSNSALALALALEANNVPNPSLQAQRVLLSVVYNAPRRFLNNGIGINDAVSAGALLYTANADGSISVWNMNSGEQEALLKDQQTSAIRALALSPDGRLLASGSTSGTITLWDTNTRQIVGTLSGHNGSVNSLAFNPTNRNQLASGGSDASTLLWNVTDGRLTRTLTSESRNAVNSVAYSPNGTSLLIISDDAMRLFSFANNAFLDFENSPSRVRAGVFSPDGTRILISGSASSSTPQLWDVARRRLLRNLPTHDAPVNSVLFSPTGEQVLSVSDDFTAILSDADTGDELRRFAAHNNRVTQAIFADDGLGVFTVSTSGEIYQWDTTQASETRTFARQTNAITSIGRVLYSPNGRYVISAVDDGSVLIWEATSDQPPITRTFERTGIPQTRLVLSPEATDDNLLAFWGATDVRLVNLTTGDTLRTFAVDEPRAFVESIAVSPDGKTMAWAGGAFFRRRASEFTRAGILTVWSVQTGARRLTLDDHNLRDTDGNLIEGINRAVTAVAISPDGRYMVSGAENGVIYLWDLTTGARLREFIGHADRITHITFSTNGTQFLTSAADRVAILWSVADGQILRRFSGHRGAVNFAAFNADNTLVVTGAQDSRIIVWDVETGQSLQQFLGGDAPITSVAFSPDSQFVLSGALSGKTTLWRIETSQQLREWTRTNRYIPQFTCSQRAQFGLPSCDASGNPPPPPPN